MSTSKIVIKWSVIGGLILVLFGVFSYKFSGSISNILQYLKIVVLLAVIILALFEYRDTLNSSFADFKDLLKVGLLIGLIIALISAIWLVIYFNFIDLELINRINFANELNMKEEGITEIKIITKTALILNAFKTSLFISAFISFISAVVIRNEKPVA